MLLQPNSVGYVGRRAALPSSFCEQRARATHCMAGASLVTLNNLGAPTNRHYRSAITDSSIARAGANPLVCPEWRPLRANRTDRLRDATCTQKVVGNAVLARQRAELSRTERSTHALPRGRIASRARSGSAFGRPHDKSPTHFHSYQNAHGIFAPLSTAPPVPRPPSGGR